MRIFFLTALLFTGAAAQSTSACLNTCLGEVATQARCSGATDALCLCTQNALTNVGTCLSQACNATDVNAAEQAAISFCDNGTGQSASTSASQSGLPPPANSRSATTTSASASVLASTSPPSNAATCVLARSGTGVIIAALGAFLAL